MRRPVNMDDKLEHAHGNRHLSRDSLVEPSPYIALRRISSNTAQRTSIRFGSYTWNRQGEPLP
jgi:hypothetical protein